MEKISPNPIIANLSMTSQLVDAPRAGGYAALYPSAEALEDN
jgi:hypothetical protein